MAEKEAIDSNGKESPMGYEGKEQSHGNVAYGADDASAIPKGTIGMLYSGCDYRCCV